MVWLSDLDRVLNGLLEDSLQQMAPQVSLTEDYDDPFSTHFPHFTNPLGVLTSGSTQILTVSPQERQVVRSKVIGPLPTSSWKLNLLHRRHTDTSS